MSNRVEHQKLNQDVAAELQSGGVFGVQLCLLQKQALIKTKTIRSLIELVPVSTEGRVEHQKLNQEAALLPPPG